MTPGLRMERSVRSLLTPYMVDPVHLRAAAPHSTHILLYFSVDPVKNVVRIKKRPTKGRWDISLAVDKGLAAHLYAGSRNRRIAKSFDAFEAAIGTYVPTIVCRTTSWPGKPTISSNDGCARGSPPRDNKTVVLIRNCKLSGVHAEHKGVPELNTGVLEIFRDMMGGGSG